MAGIVVTKDQVNTIAGSLSLELKDTLDRVEAFKEWLDGQTSETLVAMGLEQTDVDVIKSAMADAAQLADVYYGRAPIATAKDFRVFMKRLYGIGRR